MTTPTPGTPEGAETAPTSEAPEGPTEVHLNARAADAAVLKAAQAHAQARPGVALWQCGSSVALVLAWVGGVAWVGRWELALGLAPLYALLLMRVFVLQHDAGHRSLFASRRANDLAGGALSAITGIPFHPWRLEHDWHHAHQAKLSRRGVDTYNSPMTRDEAIADPERAAAVQRIVSPWAVFGISSHSLVLQRKTMRGFIFAEKAFRWPLPEPELMRRGFWTTNGLHLLWHVALLALLGPWLWLAGILVGQVLGAGLGGLLFWVQHNFEHSYHAWDEAWSPVQTAVQGSSYLKLPFPLTWFTGHIGLHHVHHLHPRIPNHGLERARRALPELAAVAPLTWRDLRRSFVCHFWDEAEGRLVDHAAVVGQATPKPAPEAPAAEATA